MMCYSLLPTNLPEALAEIKHSRFTQTQLRAKIQELEVMNDNQFNHIVTQNKEIAARDLVIKQMRRALSETSAHVFATNAATNGRYQRAVNMVQEALALKPSIELLDAYVAEAVARSKENPK